jgi:protein-histidine N-methyltransferase
VRRDLFDARFQLISEGAGDSVESGQQGSNEDASEKKEVDRKALEYLDAPSDLVPGVYEGGLKTWECSLDLVDYLDSLKDVGNFRGKKILDVSLILIISFSRE